MIELLHGRTAALAAAVLACLSAAGCGAQADGPAGDVASGFVAAIADGDGERACGLLADDTVEFVESSRDEDCPAVLAALDLPSDPVSELQVWGDGAQARTAGDTLFLRDGPSGWRVVAAGCTSRTSGPYSCELEAP